MPSECLVVHGCRLGGVWRVVIYRDLHTGVAIGSEMDWIWVGKYRKWWWSGKSEGRGGLRYGM